MVVVFRPLFLKDELKILFEGVERDANSRDFT
jgi:hypothetical protein